MKAEADPCVDKHAVAFCLLIMGFFASIRDIYIIKGINDMLKCKNIN